MTKHIARVGTALLLVLTFAGCTLKKQEAPELSGPSEFATSVAVTVSPDVLTQDGASQSVVTITARDANGQPLRNVQLRAEIRVNGVAEDFGSLSARTVTTGSDGRATLVYTAPPAPNLAVDAFTIVEIYVFPIGNDFNNTVPRTAAVRLVPPGVIVPPDGLRPYFLVTPSSPLDNQRVLFEACYDPAIACAPGNNPIATYSWAFGDGRTGSGRIATHSYGTPGTYIVTLTVTDTFGRSASTAQSLTVSAGTAPTASFTFSPTAPTPATTINFNASGSRAAPGQTIVSYAWDFGDGTSGSGVQTTHRYALIGTYTVTLVVTDDAGRTAVFTGTVRVQ